MRWKSLFVFGLILSNAAFAASHANAQAVEDNQQKEEFFETHVRPLLLDRCIECHGPKKQEGELRLDQRQQVLQAIVSDVKLIDLESVTQSRLLQVIQHAEDDVQMPPSSKLPDESIAVLTRWISEGAFWPETANLEADAIQRAEQWRQHWAFQPPVMPDLSQIPDAMNPVDYFVTSKLSEKQLHPSPGADIRTLVRRLSYALTGLPPALGDYDAAEKAAGDKKTWINQYTDQLLASPHYGERWARYWMDIARYSDTRGYVFTADREYPEAWKFREWVIRSLNADMPYDEFLKRQIAADQMPGSDDGNQLAAMGYLTLGRRFLNNKHDIIDDRIDVTIRGMQGLTIGCARCHDHKFDPIPAADYYSLYGVFDSSDEPGNEPSTLRLVDREKPVEPVIFLRGQPGNRGDRVPRRFLSALAGDAPSFSVGSGRMELAEAIASTDNPLTARVAVNRIWMHLFGRGLVDSPSDFGVRTDPPSHPELLDYLSVQFMQNNWSNKSIIRQIVTSETFLRSSDPRPDALSVDPENRLLCRMNRRRLDFEAHRDSMLMVAGRLDETIGGTSVDITAADVPPRRTVYARIDRQNLPGVFRTFDLANPDTHAPQRFETTVPQQALFQWNNSFVMQQAEAAARRTESSGDYGGNNEQRIQQLFLTILQRPATQTEAADAKAFLDGFASEQASADERSGWSYGWGALDEGTNVVTSFTRFQHYEKGRWQGSNQFPDPTLGHLTLNKGGGHTGNDIHHSVIRRWKTDTSCQVTVRSQLGHPAAQGDGVRGRLIVSDGRLLGDAVVHNSSASIDVPSVELQAGQWIDFVADCRASSAFDSFNWTIQLVPSVNGNVIRTWNSEQDFGREQSQPLLDAWSQLAQTLMLTNEFVFVD